MLGLFGTLDLARRSLQTQMTGVEVTGQNLANVNTAGYSRQRVNISSSPDLLTTAGPEGTGANATGIQQIVSDLLNSQIQSQASASGYANAQQTTLQTAQNGLDEFLNGSGATTSTSATGASTSDSGLSGQLTALFNAFSSLATSPSPSSQQAVVGAAKNLATTFNNISNQLTAAGADADKSLSNDVASANKLLSQVADLNSEIAQAQGGGGNANDLLDQREQDLENLSQLTSITTSTGTNGSVNVSIGGQTLVSGYNVSDTLQTYAGSNGHLLVQTGTGVNLSLTGGSMQGTIDARDGTLATMQGNIDSLASNLITAVNTIQNSGYNSTGGTGNSFFTGTNSATIGVNAALTNNPALIQVSGSATTGGDTSLALQISQLATSTQAGLSGQTFGDYYGATVTGLGSALSDANTQVANQTAVTNMLATQRGSVSGVNTDEEMTNLMTFQRAYEASAQLITTINTMMGDTLAMKTS
ncbi:MAG TPA: flagellar hook-associated protein FlgK [Candidatus Acidoferrales bacterium]|nr:flagellar hook-associated protein FlgK [Candidatus Acidoferrales bacterium]